MNPGFYNSEKQLVKGPARDQRGARPVNIATLSQYFMHMKC